MSLWNEPWKKKFLVILAWKFWQYIFDLKPGEQKNNSFLSVVALGDVQVHC